MYKSQIKSLNDTELLGPIPIDISADILTLTHFIQEYKMLPQTWLSIICGKDMQWRNDILQETGVVHLYLYNLRLLHDPSLLILFW